MSLRALPCPPIHFPHFNALSPARLSNPPFPQDQWGPFLAWSFKGPDRPSKLASPGVPYRCKHHAQHEAGATSFASDRPLEAWAGSAGSLLRHGPTLEPYWTQTWTCQPWSPARQHSTSQQGTSQQGTLHSTARHGTTHHILGPFWTSICKHIGPHIHTHTTVQYAPTTRGRRTGRCAKRRPGAISGDKGLDGDRWWQEGCSAGG